MRTTLDIPDTKYSRLKTKAAHERTSIRQIVLRCIDKELDGEVRSAIIQGGEAIINPPGVWHTADVTGPTTALFITAGMGTENRPR